MVQLLVHHKWFIRAGLGIFWIAELIAWLVGKGFITYIAKTNLWVLLGIVFLTFWYFIQPFYAPFCKIVKTTQGGDVVMEKSTKIMCVIIAILGTFIAVLLFVPGASKTVITSFNNSILKPFMGAWLGFVNWLDGVRGVYLLGSGILSGLILAVFINSIVRPRISGRVKSPLSSKAIRDFTPQREPEAPEPAPIAAKTVETPTASPPTKAETEAAT